MEDSGEKKRPPQRRGVRAMCDLRVLRVRRRAAMIATWISLHKSRRPRSFRSLRFSADARAARAHMYCRPAWGDSGLQKSAAGAWIGFRRNAMGWETLHTHHVYRRCGFEGPNRVVNFQAHGVASSPFPGTFTASGSFRTGFGGAEFSGVVYDYKRQPKRCRERSAETGVTTRGRSHAD